ncbi:MAG: penicillin acylase family protein, partial [Dinghuibacter sp.]|nr:penicillin acylase family protein [Dinghuibacter sp.]
SSRMNTGKPLAWSEQRSGNLMHPTLQNALSRTALPMPGYREALNAITPIPGTPNWWGPSWRMVVELGDKPKAWGIYAGGQTGNPADKGYDAFVGDWLKGAYYPLNFYMNAGEAEKQNNNTWTLN